MIELEKKSGVKYQELQRAQAEEIMSSGIHGYGDEGSDSDTQEHKISEDQRKKIVDRKRVFEDAREGRGHDDPIHSADSIAEDAMTGGGTVSEEAWDGPPEDEVANFVQEELYIHAKLLIADDNIVICGSSNINDRVSML